MCVSSAVEYVFSSVCTVCVYEQPTKHVIFTNGQKPVKTRICQKLPLNVHVLLYLVLEACKCQHNLNVCEHIFSTNEGDIEIAKAATTKTHTRQNGLLVTCGC